METFIKNELERLINEWKTENQQMIHDADFYGYFRSNHTEFKFSMGEKVLLQEANTYVKGVIEKEGLKYFSSQKSKVSLKGTFLIPNVGRFFTNIGTTQNIKKNNRNVDELKVELHQKIRELLSSNAVESDMIDTLSIDKVSIDDRDNSVAGLIPCVLCDSSKTFRINTKVQGAKLYWTFSNFQTHLTDIHKTKKTHHRKNLPKKAENSSNCKKASNSRDETIEYVCVDQGNVQNRQTYVISKIEKHAEYSEAEEVGGQSVHHSNVSGNSTILQLHIEPPDRIEYASVRDLETLIYEQISKQSLKMIEISLQNKEIVETMDFVHSDKTYDLNVVNISPDGNCLIGAMVHQIFGDKLLSKEHELAVIRLRVDVVKYIHDNLKWFELELKNRIYNIKDKQVQEGDRRKIKIENFEEEAKKFLHDYLSKDGFWGGSETIKAVSLMHNVNILTINENGTITYANGFNSNWKGTIMLAYRLNHFLGTASFGGVRNHYDSVVNIDTENTLKISEALAKLIINQNTTEFIDLDD